MTADFEISDELRQKLFPSVPPEGVEVTLLGMQPDKVVFIDDLGRDVPPAHPLRYRIFRRRDRFCLAAGVPGGKWSDCVVIPFVD